MTVVHSWILQGMTFPRSEGRATNAKFLDIDRSVEVTVVSCTTAGTGPFPLVQLQVLIDVTTMAAGFRTGRKAVYLDEIHSVPPALVFEHICKHPETCIQDTACKMMVTAQPFHIQILHAACLHLAVVSQSVGYLV